MTRVRKSAQERKLEIIQAVIHIVADVGPDKLSTQKIADEIGVTQPAIYRHFPDKSQIWLAVAKHITGEMRTEVQNAMHVQRSPIDTLRVLVQTHLGFIEKTPSIPAILFSRELHAENKGLRLYFESLMEDRQKVFTNLIKAQVQTGNFRNSLDVDDAANLILALVQGLAMRWSLNGQNFNLSQEGLQLFDLLIKAFRS